MKIVRAYGGGKFLVKYDGKISEIVKEMVNSGSEIEEVSEVNMYELYRMIMEERV